MMEANEESRSHKDWLPLRAIALEEASCHIVSFPTERLIWQGGKEGLQPTVREMEHDATLTKDKGCSLYTDMKRISIISLNKAMYRTVHSMLPFI